MAIRIPWDKYEMALLLKYTVAVEEGDISRAKAVSEVSETLRNRAVSKGLIIDEYFRNTNGISMQMSALRNCYLCVEKGLTISKLFREIVSLYKNDMVAFEHILQEESATMENSNRKVIQMENGYNFVNFLETQSYAHTKPISCTYRGSTIQCNGWNALFINLVRAFYKDCAASFPVGGQLSSSSRIDIGDAKSMIYPKEIADGIYLECNVSATGVVKKISALMKACNISTNDVIISYCRSDQNVGATAKDRKPAWSPKYTKVLVKLLSAHYQYGFRVDSPIEMMRLRNYAEEEGIDLPEADEELDREIKAAGLIVDGKLFVLSDTLLDEVGTFVDRIFSAGAYVVFVDVLMERQFEWFEAHSITSGDMFREILRKCRPNFYFGQNIITARNRISEHEAVVHDILRVAGEKSVVFYDELERQLQYIPPDKIAWSLSASPEFVWISEGKYFVMKHFVVSNEDENAVLNYVESACDNKGYASVTDIPLESIAEENYELSVTALYAATFIRILKGRYYLHGKIITKEADGVDITALLEAFCRDRDECSVAEVLDRAAELTGASNKQHSMEALYETMIRADEGHFISEKQVTFDIEKIDHLLSEVIGTGYAPIRAISTFALFPACGVSWNHYVLESFCYRFSNKYRLVVMNFNDKNAGIIKSKDLTLGYTDMLCEAAANSHIELTPDIVGQYFFDCGFTAKRKYSNLPEIIEKARKNREER